MLVKFDADTGKAVLALKATPVIKALEDEEKAMGPESRTAWRPEYGEWMVEAVPSMPYGNFTRTILTVEQNIRLRQQRIQSVLADGERVMSIVSFPTFGVGVFTEPVLPPGGPVSESIYAPDGCINPHPRFATLTANIRQRRGSKVRIEIPLFEDSMTPEFLGHLGAGKTEPARDGESKGGRGDDEGGGIFELDIGTDAGGTRVPAAPATVANAAPATAGNLESPPARAASAPASAAATTTAPITPVIDMDCMAFGMGCCCLQVTFQARDIAESRKLYDQLAVLAPLFLALTAACPILRGRLADTDVRWNTISASVDCRTPAERGVEGRESPRGGTQAGTGLSRIAKSRYAAIDLFISDSGHFLPEYNDVEAEVDEPSLRALLDGGIDAVLARHIAHLFIRDPLVIFEGMVDLDDAKSTDHFENIQSTNWQSVRWKPPPADSDIGWRVEFRTMEAQLTAYENAAFTVFIGLVSRVILFFDLNLYMPMSKVNENMATAHSRMAASQGRFYFPQNVVPLSEECGPTAASTDEGEAKTSAPGADVAAESLGEAKHIESMSLYEILMGRPDDSKSLESRHYYPGLVPLVHAYLDIIDCDPETRRVVDDYIEFICLRASGELITTATWMRNFVSAHADYALDSVISDRIAYDLLQECNAITSGVKRVPELFGSFGKFQSDSGVTLLTAREGQNEVQQPGRGQVSTESIASHFSPRRLLRGASFRDEVTTMAQCSLVRALISKYSSKAQQHKVKAESSFAQTKPFLSAVSASKD
jgi:glutamate--cysteine ligase catalytic subunit